jgi:hypothetical protein
MFFLYKHNYGLLKRNKGLYEGGGERDSMKVEKGGVYCKRYNGHYTKQLVKISKLFKHQPL